MKLNQNKKTLLDQKIKQAVDSNFKKYTKTYQLLAEYDRSPQTAPEYPAERRALQKALQQVSA